MSAPDRRARLMALMARRELALRARALSDSRAAAQEARAMTARIRELQGTNALGPAGEVTAGRLGAALWMGQALQAELARAAKRAQAADEAERRHRAEVAAAGATLRQREDRAAAALRDARAERQARAEAEQADRPR